MALNLAKLDLIPCRYVWRGAISWGPASPTSTRRRRPRRASPRPAPVDVTDFSGRVVELESWISCPPYSLLQTSVCQRHSYGTLPWSLEDPLRAKLYSEPKHFYRPTELMSVPWVAGHTKEKPRSVESRSGSRGSWCKLRVRGPQDHPTPSWI